MNFIKGWLISISGLQMRYTSLNSTKDINYVLYTGRINKIVWKIYFVLSVNNKAIILIPLPFNCVAVLKKYFF